MFLLFNDSDSNVEILRVPLADVLAPELFILNRETSIDAERKRLTRLCGIQSENDERIRRLSACAHKQIPTLTL